MSKTERPDHLIVIADHTPGLHAADSYEVFLVAPDPQPDRQLARLSPRPPCRQR